MFSLRCFWFFLCCLLALPSHAALDFFQQQPSFLPVEQAYQLDVQFKQQQLVLTWQLADGYYLYQHGFKASWQNAEHSSKALKLTLPEGEAIHDEYFGDTTVYHHQVSFSLDAPKQARLLKASAQGCADAGLCYPPYDVFVVINPENQSVRFLSPAEAKHYLQSQPSDKDYSGLWLILLSALLGGLILNLMPCVLPVLAIKLMQFTRQHSPAMLRLHGLTYLLGVLLSFLAVAAILLALRASGSAIGWGFQLQSPWFVALLIDLFFVLALGLLGFIQIGARWMGAGQQLTQGQGLSSSFFTGVLAVVVASPCTAPFMGAALGYAVAQPALPALLVFLALGFGMALPLLVLSFLPQWTRYLPKPGAWMERLKQFFAFPLLLTAVWLIWVLSNQLNTLAMALVLMGLIAIAFACWSIRLGRLGRILALLAIILALSLPFTAYFSAANAQPKSSAFMPYSAAKLEQLRNHGQAVFVDLTADWCITCLANEKTTLHTETIQQAFRQAGIVYMVGDWTNYNSEITALLSRYQRSGIPLYLLFPAKADAPAVILPQILSQRIVLNAIESL